MTALQLALIAVMLLYGVPAPGNGSHATRVNVPTRPDRPRELAGHRLMNEEEVLISCLVVTEPDNQFDPNALGHPQDSGSSASPIASLIGEG